MCLYVHYNHSEIARSAFGMPYVLSHGQYCQASPTSPSSQISWYGTNMAGRVGTTHIYCVLALCRELQEHESERNSNSYLFYFMRISETTKIFASCSCCIYMFDDCLQHCFIFIQLHKVRNGRIFLQNFTNIAISNLILFLIGINYNNLLSCTIEIIQLILLFLA